jgi:hypothetical protein
MLLAAREAVLLVVEGVTGSADVNEDIVRKE